MKVSHATYVKRRIVVVVALVLFGWMAGKAYDRLTGPSYNCPDIVVVVETGDTVWGILETYCTGEIRDAVYDVEETLGTVEIHPGQRLQLPQG